MPLKVGAPLGAHFIRRRGAVRVWPDVGHVFTEADWNTWSTLETTRTGYAKARPVKALWQELSNDPLCDMASLCPP